MNKVKGSKRNKRSNNKKTKQFRKRSNKTTRRKKIMGGGRIFTSFLFLFFIHCLFVGQLDYLHKHKLSPDDYPLDEDQTMQSIQDGTRYAINDLIDSRNQVRIPHVESTLNMDTDTNLDSYLFDLSKQPGFKENSKTKDQTQVSDSPVSNALRIFREGPIIFLQKNFEKVNDLVPIATQKLSIFASSIFRVIIEMNKEKENKKESKEEVFDPIIKLAREKDALQKERMLLLQNCADYVHSVIPLLPLLHIPLSSNARHVIKLITTVAPPKKTPAQLSEDAQTAVSNTSVDPSLKYVTNTLIKLVQSKLESDSIVQSMEYSKAWLKYILDGYIDSTLLVVANLAEVGLEIIVSSIFGGIPVF